MIKLRKFITDKILLSNILSIFIYYKFIYSFIIFGCIRSLLLHVGFYVAVRGLLTAVASLAAEHGL